MRKAIALLMALATPAFAQDAGVPFHADDPRSVAVDSAVLQPGDAGVGPGCYLRADLCMSTATELARLKAENAALKEQAGTPPDAVVKLALISGGVGLLLGSVAVVYLLRPWSH